MSAAASVRYAPEDPTLPKPWKGLVDGNTGFLYFWNPVTNVTQYQKPVASPEQPPSPPKSSADTLRSCDGIDQHSQERQHPCTSDGEDACQEDGLKFSDTDEGRATISSVEFNHSSPEKQCPDASDKEGLCDDAPKIVISNGERTPERMSAAASVRCAPEDPTLPKPWKGLVDGKTGFLYFWNPVTNVTQYEKPVASPEQPPSPPKSSTDTLSSWGGIDQHSQERQHPYTSNGENVCQDGGLKYSDTDGGKNSISSVQFNHSSPEKQCPDASDREDVCHDAPKNVISNGGQTPETMINGGGDLAEVSTSACHNGPDMLNCGISAQNLKYSGSLGSNVSSAPSGDAYRRQHEITIVGNNAPPPLTSFESTGFPPEILREVQKAGFGAPTPIQAQSWPIALQNRDIVAVAKTGSGKTLGYLLPGFIHIKCCRKNPKMGPTVLVLSPTRELATQIQVEAQKFGQTSNISCTCLYGGAQKAPQLRDLDRGVDVVVATPGRLNDILEMGRISLNQVSYLVLDEADRMLDMGFEPQIRKIVKEIPARRQTLMYTATWPKAVRNIAAELLNNPFQVNIGRTDQLVANKSISQHVEVVSYTEKNKRLEQIVQSQEPRSKIIIFCSTKRMCDQLVQYIPRQLGAAAIHGDKSQGERDYVLNQFKTGSSPILVATDVAARGLDVKDIRVVINYDFPTGIEDYVHRIGRTGRGGATGLAYTFFTDRDSKHASDLVKILEGANQKVPPELRALASRGSGMSRDRPQWSSGGRGGGRAEQNDSSYGGGRSFGRENHDRTRSRSPPAW